MAEDEIPVEELSEKALRELAEKIESIMGNPIRWDFNKPPSELLIARAAVALLDERQSVKDMLDTLIQHSRNEGLDHSMFYVDAYQCVRRNAFGEALPTEDGQPVVREVKESSP